MKKKIILIAVACVIGFSLIVLGRSQAAVDEKTYRVNDDHTFAFENFQYVERIPSEWTVSYFKDKDSEQFTVKDENGWEREILTLWNLSDEDTIASGTAGVHFSRSSLVNGTRDCNVMFSFSAFYDPDSPAEGFTDVSYEDPDISFPESKDLSYSFNCSVSPHSGKFPSKQLDYSYTINLLESPENNWFSWLLKKNENLADRIVNGSGTFSVSQDLSAD